MTEDNYRNIPAVFHKEGRKQMFSIIGHNGHQVLGEALEVLDKNGDLRTSRNGGVKVYPVPVATTYTNPQQAVVFHPWRNANPFFHLMEALWMLAGRNDSEFLLKFNSQMAKYLEDDGTFHGAYGHRWRHANGFDQLDTIVDNLKQNPDCRRQVLSMWDPQNDLVAQIGALDLPCNTHCYVSVSNQNTLDLTVCCRSNDVVYGCYGSDYVTFSILQQYLAAWLGVEVGIYVQFSNNWHGYINVTEKLKPEPTPCPYTEGRVKVHPLCLDPEKWDHELVMFMDNPNALGFTEPFFRKVAIPMFQSYEIFRNCKEENNRIRIDRALEPISRAGDSENVDWLVAGREWLERKRA